MEEKKEDIKQIDFIKIYACIKKHKKSFMISLPTTFVVACVLILCVPRWYTCNVQLAPESSSSSLSSLSTIASNFGVDIAGKMGQSQDAISPELYPNLIQSMDFRVSMFKVRIKTQDGKLNTTYYDYLTKYQKAAWWDKLKKAIIDAFKKKDPAGTALGDSIDPFRLTRHQFDIANAIDDKIKCAVDKKTDVISISVDDQDPLVCAMIAREASIKLQDFITKYRTNKARLDLQYAQKLYREAKEKYEKARRAYGAYGDANNDVVLQSYQLEAEDKENDMQLKYNAFTTVSTQLQTAQAKVQEATPAFTTLQNATVPIKPAGPKRMIFVIVMVFVAFIINALYAVIKE